MIDAGLATQAVWLLALDPQGLGGLCLRGRAGPARDAVLATLRRALPAQVPWRRLPLQVDDERLLGGLDLGLSLAAGRPVTQAGLLAEADGGVLLLPMAERVGAGLAAKLASALEQGTSSFCVVALDEGESAEEQLAAGLLERLALIVSPEFPNVAAAFDGCDDVQDLPFDLAAARQRLGCIPYDDATVQALCGAAAALGIVSLRPPWQAWRAACAAAAIAGREAVIPSDAELAARLVLAPRARSLPQSTAGSESEPEPEPEPARPSDPNSTTSEAGSASSSHTVDAEQQAQELQDQLIAATQAAIPPGLLASLAGAAKMGNGAAGRRGAAARPAQSGRPLAPRRGNLSAGSRLDLLATLRAAIPWQRVRLLERQQLGLAPLPIRLLLRRDDFHIKRYRRPDETTTVFVVDASGSQALNRLAEAKGAVELLLADCYVRRDRVALIAFRGSGAEILLAPTRSLVRARRSLSGLPGGGGTPLAAGVEAAWLMGGRLQGREGSRAVFVFLTDARANVARDGSPGRGVAMQDALVAAQRLRADGLAAVLIDTSPRPQPAAMALAQAMGARYVPLPQGQATEVHAAVTAAL